jgi:hypothetical protein
VQLALFPSSSGSSVVAHTSNVIPGTTNATDLGTSSNQWRKIYGRDYYYNGTQWGLDQANVWNTYQTINGYQFGNEKSPNGRTCLYLTSNRDTVGQSGIYITKFRQNRAQGAMNPADLQFISFDVLENSVRTNGALQLNITNWNENVPSGAVLFSNLSNAQLGSSLAPWKALNGVNPGALSLPSENYSSANLDPTNWNTNGSSINNYTPPSDGWLGVLVNSADISDLTGQYIFVGRSDNSNFWPQGITVPLCSDYNPSYLSGCVFMPVVSGKTIGIRIKMGKTQTEGSIITARFYSAQGNV